ncbi:MAG: DUF6339 family protein [Trueperaceae bacterium]
MRRGEGPLEAEVVWKGDGHELDQDMLEDLLDGLHELRVRLGEPGSGGRGYWGRFEGMASTVVHRALQIESSVAADPEFWVWLVFGREDDRFVRWVDWRHETKGEFCGARDENYGLSSNLAEGLFSRLWLRGDIGFEEEGAEPYSVALRGDQDLWRSHILRVEYAQVRTMARALIAFQYPYLGSEPTVSIPVIRAMAKELRRRHASIAFELLSDDEARQLIEEVRDSL